MVNSITSYPSPTMKEYIYMLRNKITIVGAGNVGATAANIRTGETGKRAL